MRNARVPPHLNGIVQDGIQSPSLSVRKGKVDATTFTVANQQIPTVSQKPVKSLGRWHDSSMKDTKRGLKTVELTTEGLLANNRCGLQCKLKVWCLLFMLISKLLWPLLVYEICSTAVEAIEAKFNVHQEVVRGTPGHRYGNAENPTKIHLGRI